MVAQKCATFLFYKLGRGVIIINTSNNDISQSFINIINDLKSKNGIYNIEDIFKELEDSIDKTNEIDIDLFSKYLYTIINTILQNNKKVNKDSQLCSLLLNNILSLPDIKNTKARKLLLG